MKIVNYFIQFSWQSICKNFLQSFSGSRGFTIGRNSDLQLAFGYNRSQVEIGESRMVSYVYKFTIGDNNCPNSFALIPIFNGNNNQINIGKVIGLESTLK